MAGTLFDVRGCRGRLLTRNLERQRLKRGNRMDLGGKNERRTRLFGDLAVVVFLLAQVSDGVLTYIGVSTYGASIEGNPLITWLMASMGQGAGLAMAKVTAGCFGVALHLSAVHRA